MPKSAVIDTSVLVSAFLFRESVPGRVIELADMPPQGTRAMGGGAPPGARASRPHPLRWVAARFPRDAAPGHPAAGNPMGSAEAESWRGCRSSRVEEMGEALPVLCGRDARAPGGASSRDGVAAKQVHRSSCSFVFIRGSSLLTMGCFTLVRSAPSWGAGVVLA